MKSYECEGYCTARLPDYKKCRNFKECEGRQGICKFLLFGGACDWKPDTTDLVADIFDCKPDTPSNKKSDLIGEYK